jgi:hypothetical protein
MAETREGLFAVGLSVRRCANGETHEYQLVIGDEKVGKPVWLTGSPTPGRRRHALMVSLGLHEGPTAARSCPVPDGEAKT